GETCDSAALVRAEETIELYAHTRPDGSSWSTACPVPSSGGTSGENLAIGNAAVSPATVVALWMGSKTHRANILNSEYTKLSVGFVFDLDTTYKTHWSQIFSTY
ncbi:MAG: CAP domain-containing protein, partial [Candidatus Saccharibacteria bacterium]|nr:CAP domain-containing protein [Candidatus Saccharibacteria bacterium]